MYKYKLKEKIKVGDVGTEHGITTTVTDIDPKTGTISWDVDEVPDFETVYNGFVNLNKELKKLSTTKSVDRDAEIKAIARDAKLLFNAYRTHLRKKYPQDYKDITTVSEMSSTGGGSIGGSATPGEGAQIATKYAYKLKKKPLKELDDESKDDYLDSLQITDEELRTFIASRLEGFNDIEDKLNELMPLLKQAKKETIEYYKENPNFGVVYGTDLALDYLNDLINLFTNKRQ